VSIVEERQNRRDDYLVALYGLSDGSTTQWATHVQIAEESGIPLTEIMDVGQSVSDQDHAKFMTMGGVQGSVAITPSGVRRAEQIITDRERSGAPRISGWAVLSDQELLMKLEPLVAAVREELDKADEIDPDTRADLVSDLQSATDQLRATRPNRGVIKAALGRINDYVPTIAALTGTGAAVTDILHGLGL
jgi:hypothetical protein